MPSRKKVAKEEPLEVAHCDNCGQHVEGKVKAAALNPKVKYCQYHGRMLSSAGRCPEPGCPINP